MPGPSPFDQGEPSPALAVTGPAAGVIRHLAGPPDTGGVTIQWTQRGHDCEAVITWTGSDLPIQQLASTAGADLARLGHDLGADLGAEPGPSTSSTPARLLLAADHPGPRLHPLPEAVAAAAGLTQRRDLFQLRRPLPVEHDHPIRSTAPSVTTRTFTPGADDAAWIRCNNRAFAGHPDQGEETGAGLGARIREPWFRAADFLVLDDPRRPGELAGFCWTKVHPAADGQAPLGEIYVIGVDPARQGEGLGPALVLAGLDHLGALALEVAMLYVDESNAGARLLYDRLGFGLHARRRVYTAPDAHRPNGTTGTTT